MYRIFGSTVKYTIPKELNDERERLLKQLSTTSSLEINHVNEKVKTNGKNTNAKILHWDTLIYKFALLIFRLIKKINTHIYTLNS